MSAVMDSVKSLLNAGLGFVYPEVCQVCGEGRATPAECYLCANCRASVRYIEPPFCERCGVPFQGAISTAFECSNCRQAEWDFRSARSAVIARDPVLEVIRQYKYCRAFWFEPFLADLLIQRAAPELRLEHWDWMVPVPLHPARQREREFNQAERLARRLSAAVGIPLNTRLLQRVIPTQTQTLLSRAERLANMRRAFALRGVQALQGARIVLVDDVFTTGATTGACARVLHEAGAGQVSVWTVARGI
jgi:competence protein ComFC